MHWNSSKSKITGAQKWDDVKCSPGKNGVKERETWNWDC